MRVVIATPRPLYPLGRDEVPIVHVAARARGTVCVGAENLVPLLGFDPRTTQTVASRCTDRVIPFHSTLVQFKVLFNTMFGAGVTRREVELLPVEVVIWTVIVLRWLSEIASAVQTGLSASIGAEIIIKGKFRDAHYVLHLLPASSTEQCV